jgi:hypothetical protein
MRAFLAAGAVCAGALWPVAGAAQDLSLDPVLDARLRYEQVEQDSGLRDADALTLRLRAGAEAKLGGFSLLGEGEATFALADEYNAMPFPDASGQRRPAYVLIPDPENWEVNRLQIGWSDDRRTVTLGRQRINLGDQRWVGSVGWRQNEQTFDAVRASGTLGPLTLDVTYAISQRTIFGRDAGPREAYDGHFVFANGGLTIASVEVIGFAYLLDYDEDEAVSSFSSQTYGVVARGSFAAGPARIEAQASYARQSDWRNPQAEYAADYLLAEANAAIGDLGLRGGWERLGSDNGFAVQTPMATLHKFNGFADLFLTTPAAGLDDFYIGLSNPLPLPGGLRAEVTWHQFDSAAGNIEYGEEWDVTLSTKVGAVAVLAKYADYDAVDFGADTRKLWLQAEVAF